MFYGFPIKGRKMRNKIRILIADDHPVFRTGLKQVMSEVSAGKSGPKLEIVGEASDGQVALELVRREKPDIALIDIEMPKMDGFGVAAAVQKERLPVAVVFLTMFKDEHIFNKAMDLGAMGYVLKDNAIDEVIGCIMAVSGGKHFISPSLSSLMVRKLDSRNSKEKSVVGIEMLTPTERKVLRLLSEMNTSSQIARELSISTKTVQNHRNNIVRKLGLKGNMALLKYAAENKPIL